MNGILLIGAGESITAGVEPDVHVAWDRLREQLKQVGNELDSLFDTYSGRVALSSVAVELGVTAGGEVGIIVSKAKVEVGTRITLTFTRLKT